MIEVQPKLTFPTISISLFAMKKGYFLIMGLLCCLSLAAQRDTTFFNADWDTIPSSEGAAYYRLFDKLEGSPKLYYFIDYYITGEKQAVITFRDPRGIVKSGEWTWYYKNGQISKVGSYKDRDYDGDWITYFDDGALKSKLTYIQDGDNSFSVRTEFLELYDEKTREHILSAGEGLYLTYFENGDTNIVGRVSKKRKIGTWKAYREDGSLYYVEEYKNGVLKNGVSYDEAGKKYTYTEVKIMAEYVGGQRALMQYLATIKYPFKAREDDVEGTVYVQFVIDTDGKVIEVKIARSSGAPILDDTALEHVKKCPKWIPGQDRGQKIRVQYVVPIKFKLG